MQISRGTSAGRAARSGGFTLVELVITLLVVAVLALIALPSFDGTFRQSRMTAAANNLVAALSAARSESVMRARRVSVCPSASGLRCGGSDWHAGWITYVDGGTAGRFDADDVVLRVWPALDSADRITATRAGVTFDARGMSDAPVDFIVRPDRCRSDQQRRVVLLAFGRVSSRREACS